MIEANAGAQRKVRVMDVRKSLGHASATPASAVSDAFRALARGTQVPRSFRVQKKPACANHYVY